MQTVRHRCGTLYIKNVFSLKLMAIALAASMLLGCSALEKVGILSGPEAPVIVTPPVAIPLSEQPYELNLRLSASVDMNPDTELRPSPVQVRIFLLPPQADISEKSFEEFFDFDNQLMEPRPVLTVTLRPGETKNVILPANKSQSMLAVAAAYRDPYQAIWKDITTLSPSDTVVALATIGKNNVAIQSSR